MITLPKPVIIGSLALTSANDSEERDPAELLLEGSEDGKTFRKVASAAVPLFTARHQRQQITFEPSSDAFAIYRLTFPKLQSDTNAMQIAELELFALPPPTKEIASTLAAT